MAQILYHCSPVQGLTRLEPRIGTHGQPWVYATDDLVIAAFFLGREGGDLTCQVGLRDDRPYLVERFAGALELRYGGKRGSIYVIPADGFMSGRTTWEKDLVSESAVAPKEEIRIDDAKAYLLKLAEDDKFDLFTYPHHSAPVPADNADLVEKLAYLYRQGNTSVIDKVRHYHPGLVSTVLRSINDGTEA